MDDGPRDERRPSGGAPRVIGKVIKGDSGEISPLVPVAPPSGGGGPPPRRGVVNAEEYEAKTVAKQIIADAQAKAEEIKAEALRFKEEVFAKARDEAKADVQARQAEELARAKMQAGQIIADSEKDVLELALKVAAKIISRDLERDPELVMEIVASCTEAARSSKAMIMKVHPEDGKLLREKKPRLIELIGRAVDISIRDDSEVERGGCIIQTEYGTIDGQIRTQFEMLRNVLMPADAKREVK
ncbi:MAG: FliH/SctL family protein [Archangium sp.]|nr:FliH/SctL family protein [Archangium sp.]MDP3151748.1 FliH/SctL family protein [Archangium sp.]MDP3573266.1 FliH/SctL family protein [Archangium sp.]